MKNGLAILITTSILTIILLNGCKRKTEPAKADNSTAAPNIEQAVQTEGKLAEPDITARVDSNVVSPGIPANVEERQIVATVNGVIMRLFTENGSCPQLFPQLFPNKNY